MTNKEIYVLLGAITAFFMLGCILWDTRAHDIGVAIVVLANVAFLWWCFGIRRQK